MAEDDDEYDVKMEEGEYFAIETFGTTGSGRVRDEVSPFPNRSGILEGRRLRGAASRAPRSPAPPPSLTSQVSPVGILRVSVLTTLACRQTRKSRCGESLSRTFSRLMSPTLLFCVVARVSR